MRATRISQPITLKRKCDCCKETISINKDTVDDAIFYDKKYYHRKCFIDICNKRANMKRVNVAEKWQWVLRNIKNIEAKSNNYCLDALYKEEINQFILEEYDLTIIPSNVWKKLSNIYMGTWKGMSIGISPEELIDMWKRKIGYLNKVANQKITKGTQISSDQRINYDLSILINKYDGYKKWKESQKILESDIQLISKSSSIGTSIIKEVSKKNTDKNEGVEISGLVDDIFN